MAGGAQRAVSEPQPPPEFTIVKDLPLGRHPLLTAFPGLDRLPPGRKIHPDAAVRRSLFARTCIELVDQDMWMYVAPKQIPATARARGWEPVVSPEVDCIVVGESHFRESPPLIVYLDIYHELCHVLQRQGGAELWPPGVSYVHRWTEVEGYRFAVEEARRLGADDAYLREYLKVEWITKADHKELLQALGVAEEPRRPRAKR
jgi:hypothetical protein